MKIKDLLYKIKDSEEKVSFLEKNIIIDNELKEIFIKRVSSENNKDIVDKKLTLIKEITPKNSTFINNLYESMIFINGGAAGLSLSFGFLYFFDNKLFEKLIFLFMSCIILFFLTLPFFIKKLNKLKKIDPTYYNPLSLTSTQYMYKHYKENITKVTIDLINEIESINEPELEKNKKYLSDYIAVKAFEHLEDKENTIFDEIYDQIKEKIFISNDPLNSKKILLEESLKYKNETPLNMPTIEEIKKKLVAAENKRKLLDFKEI